MLHPTLFDSNGYFYPIGNSPAMNLVGHLPPEIDAEILLLGCGDVRNILFTIFTESPDATNKNEVLAHRKYHFTCCDIEGAVIARNILLMSMILKNEDAPTMWPIYYDIFMSKKCSQVLKAHLEKLISISEDIDSWLKSDIGSVLTIGSKHTLVVVRRLWVDWAKVLTDKANEAELKKTYEEGLGSIVGKRFPDGDFVSVARSGGPLTLETLYPSMQHFNHYWQNGTTDVHQVKPPVPNPTFGFSNYGQKFSVHYGANPLSGFHLSTASVPFASAEGPSRNFAPLSQRADFAPLVKCAKDEFNLWCHAFLKARENNTWTVCFIVDDALELCGSLSPATNTTGAKDINEIHAISRGYLYNHPKQFNVIDTSNLIEHVGVYNILISALTLLRKSHISYLTTETLLNNEFDQTHGNEALHKVFGVDPASIATILGIAVIEFICDQTSISQASEFLLETLRNVGSVQTGPQKHGRLVWKWVPSFRPEGIDESCLPASKQVKLIYETDVMVDFLAAIYKKLFRIEDHSWAMQHMRERLQTAGVADLSQHNTRATYSLILQKVKRVTSGKVDWDGLVKKLNRVITQDCGSFTASSFLWEQTMLNHLYGVNTDDNIKENPSISAFLYGGSMAPGMFFTKFEEQSTITCLTVSVPIRAFWKLLNKSISEVGTPPLQLTLSCGPLSHNFCALNRKFGTLHPVDLGNSDGPKIQQGAPTFAEDLDSWMGKSDILYSCMVPTWFLLLEDGKVSISVVPNPTTAFLAQELGSSMKIFEMSLLNHEKVRLSTKFPLRTSYSNSGIPLTTTKDLGSNEVKKTDTPELSDPNSEISLGPSGSQFECKFPTAAGPHHKISQLSYRWSVGFDQSLVKLLEDKAAISTTRTGASIIRINLGPASKLVTFPFPIGETTKVSVARKSHFIEIHVPLGKDNTPPVYLHFPVGIADRFLRSIISWGLHRINLDRSPAVLIDLNKHNILRYEWINNVVTFAFSKQEKSKADPVSKAYGGNIMAEIKETLHIMMSRRPDRKSSQAAFVLTCLGNGAESGAYMLIYIEDIRLDLSGQSIVADCAIFPFEETAPAGFLLAMSKLKHTPIKTSALEMRAWLQMSVSMVERCRTWVHKPDCEYFQMGRIPLCAPALDIGTSPICSCGKGIFPQTFHKDLDIKYFLPYATRAAIGPVYPSLYSTDPLNLGEIVDGIGANMLRAVAPAPVVKQCSLCGKEEGGQKLKKCPVCTSAEYCSKDCQKKDWKAHKKTHRG
ncbi:hypothetical protein TWF730_005174 [Orbilia blumenaviensis]|uniref:MYND-type domain-containing protein n=1 Tax=Orbilia blumenaviensis TaxID=1796055 RepID=A0AAV9VJS9_9PEZI